VHIDLGVRWVGVDRKQDEVETQKLETTETETDVLALIEATYVAEYSLQGEPGKDALDEFALNNASYHVWPYWREYIMSQSMRMNLPKVALPAMQLAANKDDNVDG
jgi:preprotein translocase subunit SecB